MISLVKKKLSDKALFKKIGSFEKNNPSIAEALKTFDISMREYQQSLNALEPKIIYTSNSTTLLKK